MNPLQTREKEVLIALKKLRGARFVVIGGYAVNAYTLPRFSVDCDIVIAHKEGLARIGNVLIKLGYRRGEYRDFDASGSFARYEKSLGGSFRVSFDVLIGKVLDRQTAASIAWAWIFENSAVRTLRGKTIAERLKVRVIDLDALCVLKLISCRATDIRDIFMLAPSIKDPIWVRGEVALRCDFNERLSKAKSDITSRQFRDGLQGVYGLVDDQTFNRNLDAFLELGRTN